MLLGTSGAFLESPAKWWLVLPTTSVPLPLFPHFSLVHFNAQREKSARANRIAARVTTPLAVFSFVVPELTIFAAPFCQCLVNLALDATL